MKQIRRNLALLLCLVLCLSLLPVQTLAAEVAEPAPEAEEIAEVLPAEAPAEEAPEEVEAEEPAAAEPEDAPPEPEIAEAEPETVSEPTATKQQVYVTCGNAYDRDPSDGATPVGFATPGAAIWLEVDLDQVPEGKYTQEWTCYNPENNDMPESWDYQIKDAEKAWHRMDYATFTMPDHFVNPHVIYADQIPLSVYLTTGYAEVADDVRDCFINAWSVGRIRSNEDRTEVDLDKDKSMDIRIKNGLITVLDTCSVEDEYVLDFWNNKYSPITLDFSPDEAYDVYVTGGDALISTANGYVKVTEALPGTTITLQADQSLVPDGMYAEKWHQGWNYPSNTPVDTGYEIFAPDAAWKYNYGSVVTMPAQDINPHLTYAKSFSLTVDLSSGSATCPKDLTYAIANGCDAGIFGGSYGPAGPYWDLDKDGTFDIEFLSGGETVVVTDACSVSGDIVLDLPGNTYRPLTLKMPSDDGYAIIVTAGNAYSYNETTYEYTPITHAKPGTTVYLATDPEVTPEGMYAEQWYPYAPGSSYNTDPDWTYTIEHADAAWYSSPYASFTMPDHAVAPHVTYAPQTPLSYDMSINVYVIVPDDIYGCFINAYTAEVITGHGVPAFDLDKDGADDIVFPPYGGEMWLMETCTLFNQDWTLDLRGNKYNPISLKFGENRPYDKYTPYATGGNPSYQIIVEGGTAYVDYDGELYSTDCARPGDQVFLVADDMDAIPEGQYVSGWTPYWSDDDYTFSNAYSSWHLEAPYVWFTMPAYNVNPHAVFSQAEAYTLDLTGGAASASQDLRHCFINAWSRGRIRSNEDRTEFDLDKDQKMDIRFTDESVVVLETCSLKNKEYVLDVWGNKFSPVTVKFGEVRPYEEYGIYVTGGDALIWDDTSHEFVTVDKAYPGQVIYLQTNQSFVPDGMYADSWHEVWEYDTADYTIEFPEDAWLFGFGARFVMPAHFVNPHVTYARSEHLYVDVSSGEIDYIPGFETALINACNKGISRRSVPLYDLDNDGTLDLLLWNGKISVPDECSIKGDWELDLQGNPFRPLVVSFGPLDSAVTMSGVSLTLKGQIGIYIYAKVPAEAKTAKLTYPKTGEVKTYNLDKNPNYYISSRDQYKFLYENVPAKEMTQPLELQVFDAKGNALPFVHYKTGEHLGTRFSCQAVDYCNTILADPSQK